MGQSQTSNSEHGDENQTLDELSETEKTILNSYISKESDFQSKLAERLPLDICGNVANFLELELKNSKTQNGEWFPKSVVKLTRGTIEQLVNCIFQIIAGEKLSITCNELTAFMVELMSSFFMGCPTNKILFQADAQDCKNFFKQVLKNFPSEIKKGTLSDLMHRNSLLVDFIQCRFYVCFFGNLSPISENLKGSMPVFLPVIINSDKSIPEIPLATVAFLNSKLPLEHQFEWKLLFSSHHHGESFSKLCSNITEKGPIVIYVTDQDGHKFGGFLSTNCTYSSKFQGTERSFLFTGQPELNVYMPTGYNDHYAYLNVGQTTMPNGLGMGGQHNFFGLWLDSEFGAGQSKAKPACTTYASPQLSKKEDFKINLIEVWGVGKEPKKEDEEEGETSVLDKHLDAQALLEIAGKPRVSEGLREGDPEADIPEEKVLYHSHDPMQ